MNTWDIRSCSRRNGFVLVLVIGILGGLGAVGLLLASSSKNQAMISDIFLQSTRARLIARSGIESAWTHYSRSDVLATRSLFHKTFVLSRGQGGADRAEVSGADVCGKINVNDGLLAGNSELGSAYMSRALNPYSMMYEEASSAQINLRLRRLLNALGESIRYDAALMNGDPFLFASDASGPPGDVSRYGPMVTALGDQVIRQRPSGGYQNIEELEDVLSQWSEANALELPPGADSAVKAFGADLTTHGYLDETFARLKVESDLGELTLQDLTGNPSDKSRINPRWLIQGTPNLGNRFTTHPVSLINLNQASRHVRTAVFYAPVNVSLPTVTGRSLRHSPLLSPELVGEFSSSLPRYAHSGSPALAMGSTVFDPERISDTGGHWTEGPLVVQPNHLMPIKDARILAEAFEDYESEFGAPQSFEEFTDFLRWHWSTYLPERASELTWPQSLGEAFNSRHGNGEFLQDYLELILPHVLSGTRRLPRWLGAPACLLSPLYQPVWPPAGGAVEEGTRGLRTAEDFCVRSHHPKVMFLPSGTVELTSHGILGAPEEGECLIRTTVKFHEYKIWRSQEIFESLIFRDLSGEDPGTDAGIRVGPEFTEHNSGASEPDRYLGVIGLKETYPDLPVLDADPAFKVVLKSDPDFLNTGFSGETPPDDVNLDALFESPYESPIHRAYLDQAKFTGTIDPDSGLPRSVLGPLSMATDLSPFGGVSMHGWRHGWNATTSKPVFRQGGYWNLAGIEGDRPIIPGSTHAGTGLKKGEVILWVRLPTDYPYSSDYVSLVAPPSSNFQTLFSMTVWDVVHPYDGINSSPQDSALVRPVEIKSGLVWNPARNTYDIVARIDQSRCGDPSTKTRVNNSLYFRMESEDSQLVAEELYDESYPLPLLESPPTLLTPAMAIPANGDPSHWLSDQSRALVRVLSLNTSRPDTAPGDWIRVAVWWDLNPLLPLDDMLGVRLMESGREGGLDVQRNDTDIYDVNPKNGYRPLNLMMSYSTQNIFTLGETRGRGGPEDFFERLAGSPDDIPFYPAWRLNSSLAEVEALFGDIRPGLEDRSRDPYDLIGPASRFGSTPQHLTLRPRRHVEEAGPHQDLRLDGAVLLSFGVRAYYPKNPDTAVRLTLQCVLGDRETGTWLPPVNETELGDILAYSPASGAVMNDVSLEAVWEPPQNSSLVHACPWITDIHCHFRPVGYPKILDWRVNAR